MHEDTVRTRAFAMPLTQPGLSDRAVPLPQPRISDHHLPDRSARSCASSSRNRSRSREPLVKFEFIRMPDSTGFGDYTESGQVIPVSFRGRKGSYTHCMFLNDHPPIAGGRELWGFPKKLASPTLRTETDTLVGTLDYGPVRVATGTMGYKHKAADLASREGLARGTELPAQDHSPCRRHAAHLRARRVSPGGRRSEGGLDRSGVPEPLVACAGAGRGAAGPGGGLSNAPRRRPDARARQGRPRLPRASRSLTTGKEEPMNLHSKTLAAIRPRAPPARAGLWTRSP